MTTTELQTKLTEVETAISTALTRGLSRLTVGSVDKTYYSIKELREWRKALQDELNILTGSTGGRGRLIRTNMGY